MFEARNDLIHLCRLSEHRYSVMAGTADKILEHLLETRIGKSCDSTGLSSSQFTFVSHRTTQLRWFKIYIYRSRSSRNMNSSIALKLNYQKSISIGPDHRGTWIARLHSISMQSNSSCFSMIRTYEYRFLVIQFQCNRAIHVPRWSGPIDIPLCWASNTELSTSIVGFSRHYMASGWEQTEAVF